MDFRQLRALIAVADHGTFSAAADALDTVQSNISTHIARLEKELGSQLIDRSLNRLTLEGEAVVRRSRRISQELDNIGADVAAFRDEVMGEVRLGTIATTAEWLLPHLLPKVEKEFPDIYLRVTTGTTTSLEPQLSQGEIDLALIQEPSRNPDVVAEAQFDEDIVLVMPSSHELAGRDDLTLLDLKGFPMLLPTVGTMPRSEIDATSRKEGVNLLAKAEIDGVELTVALALKGQGLALVPLTALPANTATSDQWCVVKVGGVPNRAVAVAQNRRTLLSPPARAVKQALLEVIAEQAVARPGIRYVGSRRS